jgi:hypothetical protein
MCLLGLYKAWGQRLGDLDAYSVQRFDQAPAVQDAHRPSDYLVRSPELFSQLNAGRQQRTWRVFTAINPFLDHVRDHFIRRFGVFGHFRSPLSAQRFDHTQ